MWCTLHLHLLDSHQPRLPLRDDHTNVKRRRAPGRRHNEKSPAIVAGLSTAGVRASSGRARGSSRGAEGVPFSKTRPPPEGHAVCVEVGAFPLSSATSSAAGLRSWMRATLSPA